MKKTEHILILVTASIFLHMPVSIQQAWSAGNTLEILNSPKNPSYHKLEPINEKNCSFKSKKKCQLEISFLKTAYTLGEEGDIAGQRIVFEHLAFMKSKHGTFGLGRSYSAEYLESLNSFGPDPHLPLSYEWFRKAASLGHKGAIEKLKELKRKQDKAIAESQ